MHFLTPQECVEWCQRHSIHMSDAGIPAEPAALGMPTVRFGSRDGSLGLITLSSKLADWFEDGSERLLWITGQHHVLQMLELYRRLRRSHGDTSRLSDRPGHLFSSDEIEQLDSFLIVVLLTQVPGCIVSDAGNQLFMSSSAWLEYGSNDVRGLETKREQLRDEEVPIFAARSA